MPPSVRKTAIIPAPASGLSVLSEIVQPFLSPVLKIEQNFFCFLLFQANFDDSGKPIRALRNPRDHK